MNRRIITIWIATIVLALRSLVAPGMMVVAPESPGNLVKVEICTEYGIKLVVLDENGQPTEEKDHGKSGAHCPYGPPPLASLSTELPAIASPSEFRIVLPPARLAVLHAKPRAFRHARGPPDIS